MDCTYQKDVDALQAKHCAHWKQEHFLSYMIETVDELMGRQVSQPVAQQIVDELGRKILTLAGYPANGNRKRPKLTVY